MTNRKIALFVPSLHGGGAERIMVNLARGLTERGFGVDLVLAEAAGPYLSEIPACVRVVDLRVQRVRYAIWGLTRYLRRERPAVLLSTLRHANVIAVWARRFAGVPVRLVLREAASLVPGTQGQMRWRSRLMTLAMQVSYSRAEMVVAVSRGVAEDLIRVCRLPPAKVRVIYNPVVAPELLNKAAAYLDHPWFEPTELPVILGVGRLVEQKDFSTLLRAFAMVRARCPSRLMILGEGPERARLEDLARRLGIESDFQMPGFVRNPYSYMKRAAVFVLSSRWEGFPSVLAEAMVLGTPVVSTDCPSGPAEILEQGKWGQLVPVGDAERLADAIVAVLRGKKTDARTRALAFTAADMLDEYIAICGLANGCYRKAIGNHGRRPYFPHSGHCP